MIEQLDRYIPAQETLSQRDRIRQDLVIAVRSGDIAQISRLGDQALETAHPTATLYERWEVLAELTPYHLPHDTRLRSIQMSSERDQGISQQGKKAFIYTHARTTLSWVNKYIEDLPDNDSRDELLKSIIADLLALQPDLLKFEIKSSIPRIHQHMRETCEQFRDDYRALEAPLGPHITELREQDPTTAEATKLSKNDIMDYLHMCLTPRGLEAIKLRFQLEEGGDDELMTYTKVGQIMGIAGANAHSYTSSGLNILRSPHYYDNIKRRYRQAIEDHFRNPDNIREAEEPRLMSYWYEQRRSITLHEIKLASGYPKPTPEDVKEYHLGKLPITVSAWKRLASIGMVNLGDFFSKSPEELAEAWNSEGYNTAELVKVIDTINSLDMITRLVDPFYEPKDNDLKLLGVITDKVVGRRGLGKAGLNNLDPFELASIHFALDKFEGHRHLYTPEQIRSFERLSKSAWLKTETRARQKLLETALKELEEYTKNHQVNP